MINLALKIPGFNDIYRGPDTLDSRFDVNTFSIGFFITDILPVIFLISSFLAFIWIVWGAFQWIFSQGDKGAIQKAQQRITYALVGLALMLISFLISNYARDVLLPKNQPVKDITIPPITFILKLTSTPVYAQIDLKDEYAFGDIESMGKGTNRIVRPAFSIAGAALVFYFVLAGFRIISSGGDKEALGKAQKMVTHGIIGFVILMLSFLILRLFFDLLFGNNNLDPITPFGP